MNIIHRPIHSTHYYTMKISFMYHRPLIYDVKITTIIDGMGPFNSEKCTENYIFLVL